MIDCFHDYNCLFVILVVPFVEDLSQFERECLITATGDVFGYRHGGSSDVASHTGHGVCVATKRNGTDDGIHEVCSFEETDNGFRHALVAGGLKRIVWADLVSGSVEVVAEKLLKKLLSIRIPKSGYGVVETIKVLPLL